MNSCRSSFGERCLLLLAAIVLCAACGAAGNPSPAPAELPLRVAVLPVHDLSGGPAPLKEIEDALTGVLARLGFDVLGSGERERIMADHRIRYTGGIDGEAAAAFRSDADVGAVLVTTLELYSGDSVPKVALISRLVSTEDPPAILWMETVGMTGDDTPGVLGLGLIKDPAALLAKASASLEASLAAHRAGTAARNIDGAGDPQVAYRSPVIGLHLQECRISFAQRRSREPEDLGPTDIPVVLSTISEKTVTVRYAVTGGTARNNGEDFRLRKGKLTFPPGETVRMIRLDVKRNSLPQDDRTVDIGLSRPENAVLGDAPVHTRVIVDDDPPPAVTFGSPGQRMTERARTILVPIRLLAPSGKEVAVPYEIAGSAANDADYRVLTPNPLVIPPRMRKAEIRIELVDDDLNEDEETISLTLGTPVNGTGGSRPLHTVTIADEDPLPAVRFRTPASEGVEAAGPAVVEVVLSGPSGRAVEVEYDVTGGTARPLEDFRANGRRLRFEPGETTKAIELPVIDNTVFQHARTIELSLLRAEHAVLEGGGSHVFTIADDDAPPAVAFTLKSQNLPEGAGAVVVPVRLSALAGKDVVVPYTISGTAADGHDYRLVSPNPIVIAAGAEGADIVLIATDNRESEYNKVLVITLGPPANAVPGADLVHTITLDDNDGPRKIAVLPFFNRSGRDEAGDLVMLHLVRRLAQMSEFRVIEPGMVRQTLLSQRVIMHQGISSAEADVLARGMDADLLLTGLVTAYDDQAGSWGAPQVDFSARLIERESKKIVWAVKDSRRGDDAVVLFDFGKIFTANRLASEMALVVRDIVVP